MYKFSIVIPIYNEAENILNLINEIKNNLDDKIDYEIIIVNDCSTDNTKLIIDEFKLIDKIKIIENSKNLGQSKSILNGILISKYDNIITIDGDGQNNPNDIIRLIEIYDPNSNAYLVGGIRVKRKDKLYKIISSKIANFIRNLILQDECIDTGCALKIFNKNIFLQTPFFNGIHRFLPAIYKAYGSNNLFINVDHRSRKFGISKYGTFDRLFAGIRDVYKVTKIIKKIKIKNA